MLEFNRRDFLKVSIYSVSGILFGQKTAFASLFGTPLDLSTSFNYWGQGQFTFQDLEIPFFYLPNESEYPKKAKDRLNGSK